MMCQSIFFRGVYSYRYEVYIRVFIGAGDVRYTYRSVYCMYRKKKNSFTCRTASSYYGPTGYDLRNVNYRIFLEPFATDPCVWAVVRYQFKTKCS